MARGAIVVFAKTKSHPGETRGGMAGLKVGSNEEENRLSAAVAAPPRLRLLTEERRRREVGKHDLLRAHFEARGKDLSSWLAAAHPALPAQRRGRGCKREKPHRRPPVDLPKVHSAE